MAGGKERSGLESALARESQGVMNELLQNLNNEITMMVKILMGNILRMQLHSSPFQGLVNKLPKRVRRVVGIRHD